MRLQHWLICFALYGCGSARHDDPQAGTGGENGRSDAGHELTGGHSSGASGHAGTSTSADGGRDAAAADSGAPALLHIPRVYPLVRASTPVSLIADAAFRTARDPSLDIFGDAGMSNGEGSNSLRRIAP